MAPLQELLTTNLAAHGASTLEQAKRISLSQAGWEDGVHLVAYRAINLAVAHHIMLAHQDPSKATCVWTDASARFWAGVVTQCPIEDLLLPVMEQRHEILGCVSGRFTGSMLNWATVDQEAYAVKETMVSLQHLMFHPRGVEVFTDHRNLEFIFGQSSDAMVTRKQAAARLERWAITLRGFHFRIRHVPGTVSQAVFSDAMSRWANPHFGKEPADGPEYDPVGADNLRKVIVTPDAVAAGDVSVPVRVVTRAAAAAVANVPPQDVVMPAVVPMVEVPVVAPAVPAVLPPPEVVPVFAAPHDVARFTRIQC